MNLTTVLDLIAERETAAGQAADRLRQQITTLTAELAQLERDLADLATTRTTLQALTAAEFTAEDPTVASAPYQQILTILGTAPTGMRAKDICIAIGIEPSPKHVERARAKLKRLVSRQILTETEPGLFALAPKRT